MMRFSFLNMHRFARPRSLLHAQRGSAMPLVAFGVLMLVGATGIAIDMSRVQIVQSRMQNALDAAGLAVGSEASTVDVGSETTKYFYANFPAGYLGTVITSGPTATPNDNNSLISLSVSGTVGTTFMQLFHVNSVNVSAASQITRQSKGMELVLVLDNTGSMNSPVNPADSNTPKIQALQSAATTLLNILYGSNNTVPTLWVGVVPFSQTVNIGTGYGSWMDGTYDSTLDFGPIVSGTSCPSYTGTSPATPGTYNSGPQCRYAITTTASNPPSTNFGMGNWSGCVMARATSEDTSDDPPSVVPFQAYDYPNSGIDPWRSSSTKSNQTCTGSGKNKTCTTTSYTNTTSYNYSYSSWLPGNYGPNLYCPHQVLPMVAEKSTVTNEINALTAGGSTEIDLGMAWGWRMLSPRWRGLWGGEMDANSLPQDYNTPLMNKVVILMTDGMNSVDSSNYTAYGWLSSGNLGTTNATTADSNLDSRTLAVCNSLKANGVIIYTIGFGTTDDNDPTNPTSVNGPLLRSCASEPDYYFLAPTNAQLTQAFQQIGDSLANLFISQ